MTKFHLKVEEDRKTATLKVEAGPDGEVSLDAAGVEKLIAGLGVVRSQMAAEIKKDHQLGTQVEAILDPFWAVEPELMMGGSLFHVRDPRYG